MAKPFPDRSKALFGREADLAYLLERAEHKGITAVVARAQMGKTWLLTETARRLTEDSAGFFVGFTDSAEPTDLFLRAVGDLYARWLSSSSFTEQARMTWQQQQKDLVGRTGSAAGSIFQSLGKIVGAPAATVGGLVKDAFDGMAKINRELISGGKPLPGLESDETRELLESVYNVDPRHMVLIFDQWEKSPDIAGQSTIMDIIRRNAEDWPPCHIFIGLQPGGEAHKAISGLQKAAPQGWLEIKELQGMQLETSVARHALLAYIRERIPATRAASDRELLGLIDGYPGVVYQWVESRDAFRRSLDDLRQLAIDANNYRFRELEELLPHLTEPERTLAMRFALLPPIASEADWKLLRTPILEGCGLAVLDSLRNKELLKGIRPPTYDHPKRGEAALRWFRENREEEELKEVSEGLILAFAPHLRKMDSRTRPFITAVASLAPIGVALSREAGAIRHIVRAVLGLEHIGGAELASFARAIDDGRSPSVAPILAIGLFNFLEIGAALEMAGPRDKALDALRTLARAYPADTVVCDWFAKGLVNVLDQPEDPDKPGDHEALLTELRRFYAANPGSAEVREWLSAGLFNALDNVRPAEFARRETLLDELRDLAEMHVGDAVVRSRLSNALFNVLNDMLHQKEPEERDRMLDELRRLTAAFPQDMAVLRDFSNALFNTYRWTIEDSDPGRPDALLQELRQLAIDHPASEAVSGSLARALFYRFMGIQLKEPPSACEAIVDELRKLAAKHPKDAETREWFAKTLLRSALNFKQANSLPQHDLLFDELRQLAAAYPKDTIVRACVHWQETP